MTAPAGNLLYDALFAPHCDSDAVFLRCPGRPDVTHRQFAKRISEYAGVLRDIGVGKGDRVAVQVAKSPEALAVYGACVKTGAVFLPLNTAYTPDEIGYFINDAEPRLVLCDQGAEPALKPHAATARLMTLNAEGRGSLSDMADRTQPLAKATPCDAGDLAAILYTSGTTGRSKGAMLSHDNLLSNARTLAGIWRFSMADTLLHALPIFHTHGLFVAVNVCLLAGCDMVFLRKFDIDAVVEWLPLATAMMGVPTFYTRLLDDPRLTRDLTAHMRLFVSGSAPLLSETHARFETRTGHRILERYGMTETNMNTSNPYDGARIAGTVGQALPGVELRITDPDTGNPLPTGDTGMIEVRGPNVFQGYWRMPEKTAEELRPDGFFITGDLGNFDDAGYIRIVGRQKDLIISGGYNIYPKEVEMALDDQPGVQESAVFGVPDPDFGEAVIAVAVPAAGARPDPETLIEAIGARLARFKRPRRIFFVQALPRNTMGKVQKNVLRAEFSDCLTDQ